MQFKLGDKILFKTENQKGEIVKINSIYKVTVQTEDGFEVLASVKDLVKVEVNTDKASLMVITFIKRITIISQVILLNEIKVLPF